MTQELIELRTSILEGRYADALSLLDELEGMSKKAILRNIRAFLVRLLIYLIKNQVEQRLNNSWAASIRDSLLEIQDLNLKENQTSYYVKPEEWKSLLEDSLEDAIRTASVEVLNGAYSPFQLLELVDQTQILMTTRNLLNLTYKYSAKLLPGSIDESLSRLPGGEDWKFGRKG